MKTSKRWVILAGAAALVLFVAQPAVGLLTDMAGHWSGPLIAALNAKRIISGDEQGRFTPDGPLTRAQLAKLLVTGLGYQDDAQLLSAYPSRFHDVPKWHWANGFVESLAELAAVEGYPGGGFGPEDQVTRAQLAVILVRLAGLTNQARGLRFEATSYRDDAQIQDWARGYVQVARSAGLMEGFENGEFRPQQAVTRAEGSAAIFRLMNTRGQMFHLSGTLVKFDPSALTGVVRNELGQERTFVMSGQAEYHRGGVPSAASQVRVLDQVWIILGPDGTGTFLDARYHDVLGNNLTTDRNTVTLTLADGTRTYNLQPGALTFLNGKAASIDKLNGAQVAYLILDRSSGQVRAVDALTATVRGQLIGLDPAKSTIFVQTERQTLPLVVDQQATILRNGEKIGLSNLIIGDRVQVVVDSAGTATYVLAER